MIEMQTVPKEDEVFWFKFHAFLIKNAKKLSCEELLQDRDYMVHEYFVNNTTWRLIVHRYSGNVEEVGNDS